MPTQREIIRNAIVADTLFATRFFFSQTTHQKFNVGEHHKKIAEVLDDMFCGKATNIIINLPPRYSKTEIVVKTLIAKGLAINPAAKFIHLSYSANLALDNSEHVKGVVASDWYKSLFPNVEIKRDSNAKQKWYTTAGGGVYATSSCGQVTGFGAGAVNTNSVELDLDNIDEFLQRDETPEENGKHVFGGAIIIDDPLKPIDATSPVMRQKVKDTFENTIRSRVNDRNTPIIIIMQRVHKDDLSGYLQEVEPDKWRVLSLPAISTDENGEEHALWPFKHTLEDLHHMRETNRFVFETQYQQNPQVVNERLWLFAFDREKHVGHVTFNPMHPLVLSFDFNRNPMTCTAFQHINNHVYGVECFRMENATTAMLCAEIKRKYPKAMLLVTGDCAGSNLTTMSLINNYDVVKNFFRLTKSQMQYSGQNPRLADSRYFMNAIFERVPITFDAERCKPAIFDFENVMADENNKLVKASRENVAQQADFLDNCRYYFHRYFSKFATIM